MMNKNIEISIKFFQILLEKLIDIKDEKTFDISRKEGFNLKFLENLKYGSIKMCTDFFNTIGETYLNLENDSKAIFYYTKGLYYLIISKEKEAVQSFEQSLKTNEVFI